MSDIYGMQKEIRKHRITCPLSYIFINLDVIKSEFLYELLWHTYCVILLQGGGDI